MSLLEAALAYAAQGWPVFPCKPDKRPYTQHGFNDATTIELHIVAWWKKWPEALIGVPTGLPATGDVCDVDGDDGRASLESLGITPSGPRAKTARDGLHLWYAPGSLSTSARKLPGLDTRGTGGYVIVPPSVSPAGRYEWIQEPVPGEPLPEPPSALRELASRRAPLVPITGDPVIIDSVHARAILRMAGIPLLTIADGERNVRLFKLAASLRARGSEAQEILDIIGLVNGLLCRPPMTAKEVATISASASRKAMSPAYQQHAEVIRQAEVKSSAAEEKRAAAQVKLDAAEERLQAAQQKVEARAAKVAEKAAVIVSQAEAKADELLEDAAATHAVDTALREKDLATLRSLIHEQTGIRIERVLQVGIENPHYVLDLGSVRVPVGNTLLRCDKVAEAVFRALRHTGFACLTNKRWVAIRDALAALIVVIDDIELTRTGQTLGWVRDMYQRERQTRTMKKDIDTISNRLPFVDDDWLYVNARGFSAFLTRAGVALPFQEVGQRLAEVGERKGSGIVTVPTPAGPEQARYWRVKLNLLLTASDEYVP